jgi:hypothetical protein
MNSPRIPVRSSRRAGVATVRLFVVMVMLPSLELLAHRAWNPPTSS